MSRFPPEIPENSLEYISRQIREQEELRRNLSVEDHLPSLRRELLDLDNIRLDPAYLSASEMLRREHEALKAVGATNLLADPTLSQQVHEALHGPLWSLSISDREMLSLDRHIDSVTATIRDAAMSDVSNEMARFGIGSLLPGHVRDALARVYGSVEESIRQARRSLDFTDIGVGQHAPESFGISAAQTEAMAQFSSINETISARVSDILGQDGFRRHFEEASAVLRQFADTTPLGVGRSITDFASHADMAPATSFMRSAIEFGFPGTDLAHQALVAATLVDSFAANGTDISARLGRSPLVDLMAVTRDFLTDDRTPLQERFEAWISTSTGIFEAHLEQAESPMERYALRRLADWFFGNWLTLVALLVSVFALLPSHESNDLAREGNEIAREGNAIARQGAEASSRDTVETRRLIREEADASRQTAVRETDRLIASNERLRQILDEGRRDSRREAIVVEDTPLLQSADPEASEVVLLHRGTLVLVVEDEGDWLAVSIYDYLDRRIISGWLEREKVAER